MDTYKIVKRLREAGFSEVQAEAVTAAVQDAAALDLAHLATKADLETANAGLRTEFAVFKSEMRAEMADMKSDILKWMAGTIAGAVLINMLTVLAAMYGPVRLLGH